MGFTPYHSNNYSLLDVAPSQLDLSAVQKFPTERIPRPR